VRLERQAHLNDTEAEQNKTDSTDKSEHKVGEIIQYALFHQFGKPTDAYVASRLKHRNPAHKADDSIAIRHVLHHRRQENQ